MAGVSLVTGATGFIGSHLARQLLERGESVRVLVRDPAKLRAVGLADAPGLEVAQGDLLEPATIRAALAGVRRLYHVAGYISTARDDRDDVYRLNVDTTSNLFTAASSMNLDKIVYLASIFALGGGRDETPVDEGVAYDLSGFGVDYFVAKRRAELDAREQLARGLPLVFVYPCFCYGPGDVHHSSSRLIELHLARRLVATIDGGQNAMDVRDAAAGLIRGMERGRIGERYLIGGGNYTNSELGQALADITGYRAPMLRLPGGLAIAAGKLAERVWPSSPLDAQSAKMAARFWYYDDSKARRELGHTSRPLAETLRAAIEWFVVRGQFRRPPQLQ